MNDILIVVRCRVVWQLGDNSTSNVLSLPRLLYRESLFVDFVNDNITVLIYTANSYPLGFCLHIVLMIMCNFHQNG